MLEIHLCREMEYYWEKLCAEVQSKSPSAESVRQYKRLEKALKLLSENPRHPGLQSHKISALSRIAGYDVWESYLQNNTPSAGRLFWRYGPSENSVTVLSLEPHPNDKGAYKRVKLPTIEDT